MLRSIVTIIVAVVATVLFGVPATLGCIVFRNGNVTNVLGGMWSRVILRAAGIRVTYVGLENLATGRPSVFIANHQSMVDIWALLPVLPRQTRFVAKESLFRIPVLGWAIGAAGFVPIDRSNLGKAMKSLEKAGQRIREGSSVILFPEGTRSKDGRLRPFKKGAFHLALAAGAPIVPVTIAGSFERIPPKSIRITPGEVHVHFDRPVDTTSFSANNVADLRDTLQRCIAENLDRIRGRTGPRDRKRPNGDPAP